MTVEEVCPPADSRMDEIEEEKLINEEYKIWKKNAPFLYDLVVTHALDWPSLTVDWLPDLESNASKQVTTRRLLLGTNTSNAEPNYLSIASVTLPSNTHFTDTRGSTYDDDRTELGGFGGAECRIQVTNKIIHEGEVNRARHMPQNPCLIGTRTVHGDVLLYDYTKHPSVPSGESSRPDLRMTGHRAEGYGLCWNKQRKGWLLSSDNEGVVCVWDVTQGNKEHRTLSPVHLLSAGSAPIEDICWHAFQPDTFSSVGDDRRLLLWDLRGGTQPVQIVEGAHAGELNCVAHNPNSEHLLVTGSADQTVALWDIRHLGGGKVHTLAVHQGDVLQVAWSPFHENVLASGGVDRRINIWDLSRIGMEQDAEDAEDGPPELLFVHGGHTARISDFSWDLHQPWLLASTADDNVVHIWKLADTILNDEGYEDEEEEESEDEEQHQEEEEKQVEERQEAENKSYQAQEDKSFKEDSDHLLACDTKEGKVSNEASSTSIPDIVIDSPEEEAEQNAKKIHLE